MSTKVLVAQNSYQLNHALLYLKCGAVNLGSNIETTSFVEIPLQTRTQFSINFLQAVGLYGLSELI